MAGSCVGVVAVLLVICVLWLFGGLTEVGQGLTPTRRPDLQDLAFDVAGSLTGFLAGSVAWRAVFARLLRG